MELRILAESLDLLRRVPNCRVICGCTMWTVEAEIAQVDALKVSNFAVLRKKHRSRGLDHHQQ